MTATAGVERWVLLNERELICAGDEYFWHRSWQPVERGWFGREVDSDDPPIRRRWPPPAAQGDEAVERALTAYDSYWERADLQAVCEACGGRGSVGPELCDACGGNGANHTGTEAGAMRAALLAAAIENRNG